MKCKYYLYKHPEYDDIREIILYDKSGYRLFADFYVDIADNYFNSCEYQEYGYDPVPLLSHLRPLRGVSSNKQYSRAIKVYDNLSDMKTYIIQKYPELIK